MLLPAMIGVLSVHPCISQHFESLTGTFNMSMINMTRVVRVCIAFAMGVSTVAGGAWLLVA